MVTLTGFLNMVGKFIALFMGRVKVLVIGLSTGSCMVGCSMAIVELLLIQLNQS